MKTVKLPFALNENNILVHISEVENGKKCCCICTGCRLPLIAAKGTRKRHHFKHAADNECESGFESSIHLAAKQVFMKEKQIKLPNWDYSVLDRDSKGINYSRAISIEGREVCFDSVQEEMILPGIRADILAKKEGRLLIIEIYYRHKVEDQKIQKIIKADISAIEINLSDLTPEDINNWDAFWSYLNDPRRIKWLHNAKSQEIISECKKQLTIEIQKREDGYKQEEIEEKKREVIAKEQLIQTFDELKTLSSEESVKKLKQAAEAHPVWKANMQHLPFSWRNLPHFVDAYVPNGDWILGCDRRVWQTEVYRNFIYQNENPFSVREIDDWLRKRVGLKVPSCVGKLAICGKSYPQLIPFGVRQPSSWETIRAYCNYLCKLGMLVFVDGDWHYPGDCFFCPKKLCTGQKIS